MSPDLKDLLDDAARTPRRGLDVDEIHRRGRRGRATERIAGATAAVLVLGGVAFGVDQLRASAPEVPAIGEPSPGATASPDGAAVTPLPLATAADLGLDVLFAVDSDDGDGRVEIERPDGATRLVPVDVGNPSATPMVSDGRGGFVYQPLSGAGGSPPVLHVDAAGATATLLPATTEMDETYRLVGSSGSGALVARRSASSVALLEVTLNGDLLVLHEDVAGLLGDVLGAGSLEVSVYALRDEELTDVVVRPPDREPTSVWSGGAPGPEDAIDVVITRRDARAFALISTTDGAAILRIDQFAETPTVVERLDIPLRAGATGQPVEAVDLDAADGTLLVNRRLGDRWLPALVLEVAGSDLADATWQVLERPGRAVLGASVADETETAAPGCSDDVASRDAEPSDDGTLDLYLTCAGETEPWHAYRRATAIEETGDVERDATAILDLLFTPVDDELADQGYSGLTFDVYDDGSGFTDPRLGSVAVTGGTVVIDFDAPDGYGFYGTSHAGSVFHTLVTANVLQLRGIDTVEIRNGGSCEAHSGMFESEGCFRLTLAEDAPWNGDRVFD